MRRIYSAIFTALLLSALLIGIGATPATAAFPGENGRIAFWADLGLGGEIFTIRPNGTGLRQLTEGSSDDANSPHWSPDGLHIAFWISDVGVYVMNRNGTDQTQVTAPGGQTAYTPDEDQLVYECPDCAGGDGVFLMAADGSDAPGLRLSTNPFPDEGDGNPQVSPDGQTVTFVRHKVDGELQALFAVDIDGTNERMIVPYTKEVGIKHDWSPNGRRIVITPWADFPDGKAPTVATIKPDGSDFTLLTRPHGGSATLAGSFSPDGRWIAYRFENQEAGVYRLMRMHPDGTSRAAIVTLPFAPRGIDWGVRPT